MFSGSLAALEELCREQKPDIEIVVSDGRVATSKLMLSLSSRFLAFLLIDPLVDLIIIEDITVKEFYIMFSLLIGDDVVVDHLVRDRIDELANRFGFRSEFGVSSPKHTDKDEEGADETSVTHATNTAAVAENEKTLPFKKRTVYNGMKKVEKADSLEKKSPEVERKQSEEQKAKELPQQTATVQSGDNDIRCPSCSVRGSVLSMVLHYIDDHKQAVYICSGKNCRYWNYNYTGMQQHVRYWHSRDPQVAATLAEQKEIAAALNSGPAAAGSKKKNKKNKNKNKSQAKEA